MVTNAADGHLAEEHQTLSFTPAEVRDAVADAFAEWTRDGASVPVGVITYERSRVA